jgi:hypothetical protein
VAPRSRLDLIDEYRPRVHPVLIGGGTTYYPRAEDTRTDLELLASRTFPNQVVGLRYRVKRDR